jgi:hypothetical protein
MLVTVGGDARRRATGSTATTRDSFVTRSSDRALDSDEKRHSLEVETIATRPPKRQYRGEDTNA